MADRGAGKATFEQEMRIILGRVAAKKGYNGDALFKLCGLNMPHALGEIIYKAVRYHRKRNPEDLIKIASWARLAWEEHHRENGNNGPNPAGSERRDRLCGKNARTVASARPTKVSRPVAGRGRRTSKGAERRDKKWNLREEEEIIIGLSKR